VICVLPFMSTLLLVLLSLFKAFLILRFVLPTLWYVCSSLFRRMTAQKIRGKIKYIGCNKGLLKGGWFFVLNRLERQLVNVFMVTVSALTVSKVFYSNNWKKQWFFIWRQPFHRPHLWIWSNARLDTRWLLFSLAIDWQYQSSLAAASERGNEICRT